jgi:hypothetical protein
LVQSPPASVLSTNATRASAPSIAELGAPRETAVVNRYLPDSSLRYSKLPIGSGTLPRFSLLLFGSLAGVLAVLIPVWRLVFDRVIAVSSASALAGVLVCALLFKPVVRAAVAIRSRAFFRSRLKAVSLGLDRAVFQPGNTFRYEIHLPAIRPIELHELQIRLVFWESWRERQRMAPTRFLTWVEQKQGHDVVRQLSGTISLVRDQHCVVRGEICVPRSRPTEHHRGQRKHISYVNITVTLGAWDRRKASVFRADCPRLITFPWM